MKNSWFCKATVLALTLAPGCRKNTSFTSFSPDIASNGTAIQGLGNSTMAAPKAPTNCIPGKGATSAKILTPEVKQGAGAEVRYEISVVDCNGATLPFEASYLAFDVDAVTRDVAPSLPFRIQTTDGKEQVTGTLNVVTGSDLFGNVGSYFHHRSNAIVRFAAPTKTLLLSIDLSRQTVLKPRGAESAPAVFQIPTFLKFGEAAPAQALVSMQRVE